MKLKPIPPEEQLPDGVYIGLPDTRYFQQRCLGSSDLSLLWDDDTADGWWWKSPNNPHYRRKPSDATDFGSALHCLGLEGREAYAARYAVAPNPLDYPDLLVSVTDLKSALYASDAPAMPSRSTKKDLIEAAKIYLPNRPIWDVIEEKAKKAAGSRTVISAEMAYQIEVMVAAGLHDPIMNAVFTAEGGVRVTELSVFWTLPSGTRMRFRFDSLLPMANCDLKSIDSWRKGEALADAAGKAIGERSLDIQAALSFTARRKMYEFITAGKIWGNLDPAPGATDPQQIHDWLQLFPSRAPLRLPDDTCGWRWLWAFFQKPNLDGRAPTILPVWLEFGSLDHRDGYRKAAIGVANYEERVRRFGLSEPWTTSIQPHHLNPAVGNELQVRIPSWIKQPAGVADEENELTW